MRSWLRSAAGVFLGAVVVAQQQVSAKASLTTRRIGELDLDNLLQVII